MPVAELVPSFEDDDVMRKALREPFPPEQIGKLPASQRRPALDFVGHAAVTQRLNDAAPGWFYTVDELFSMGSICWIRGTMTIGGVSRIEYGDGDDPKDAIGNFIRRGAMRFGVALDLWSRQELKAPAEPTDADSSPASGKQAPSEPKPPASAEGGPTPDPSVGQGAPPNLSPSEVAPVASGGDSSSAAPNAAGTLGGEGQAMGKDHDPNLPTSRRDQLWKNLVEFAGTKKKALNAVNQTMKASWTEPHIGDIPEDDIENTLKAFMQRESVA
jgi:hypothetical protein